MCPIMMSKRAPKTLRIGLCVSAQILLAGCAYRKMDARNRALSDLQQYLITVSEPSIRESMSSRLYWRLRDDLAIGGVNSNWLAGACYNVDRDILVVSGLLFSGDLVCIDVVSNNRKVPERALIYSLDMQDHMHRISSSAEVSDSVIFRIDIAAPEYDQLINAIKENNERELWIEVTFSDGRQSARCPIIFYREGRTLRSVSRVVGDGP